MSWQRILESARKNGFPVIVTDIAGREPMVIMPFDAFEEMNEVYQSSLDSWEDAGEEFEYSDINLDSGESAEPSVSAYDEEAPVGDSAMPEERKKPSLQEKPEGSMDDVSHLSMEERFYLEPVDDQN